jgi:hypothetical protein
MTLGVLSIAFVVSGINVGIKVAIASQAYFLDVYSCFY